MDKPWTVHVTANASVSITGYSGSGSTQTEVTTSINLNADVPAGVMAFTSAGPGPGASGGPVMAVVGPAGERAVIGTYNTAPPSGPHTGLYLKYTYLDAIKTEMEQAEAAIDPNALPKIYIFGSESAVNEEITGTHRRDVIDAGGGNDILKGEGGDDWGNYGDTLPIAQIAAP